jgi:hypothetical protein
VSLLNDNSKCYGASQLDWRWAANCKACLRRTESHTRDTVVMIPPLFVDNLAACPLRVTAQRDGEEEQ